MGSPRIKRYGILVGVGLLPLLVGFFAGRLAQKSQEREIYELRRELDDLIRTVKNYDCECQGTNPEPSPGSGDLVPTAPQKKLQLDRQRCLEAGGVWESANRLCEQR